MKGALSLARGRAASTTMLDSAGTEIVVGCRVSEFEFGFGDGTVESIDVPCVGGGFNVGVKWDDVSKGRPSWSAAGGGRGAQHLLVIEQPAAAQPAAQPAAAEPAIDLAKAQPPSPSTPPRRRSMSMARRAAAISTPSTRRTRAARRALRWSTWRRFGRC